MIGYLQIQIKIILKQTMLLTGVTRKVQRFLVNLFPDMWLVNYSWYFLSLIDQQNLHHPYSWSDVSSGLGTDLKWPVLIVSTHCACVTTHSSIPILFVFVVLCCWNHQPTVKLFNWELSRIWLVIEWSQIQTSEFNCDVKSFSVRSNVPAGVSRLSN